MAIIAKFISNFNQQIEKVKPKKVLEKSSRNNYRIFSPEFQ